MLKTKLSQVFIIITLCATFSYAKSNQPSIGYIYPSGGQQGATFKAIVGGQFLKGCKEVYFSGKDIQVKIGQYIPVKSAKSKNKKKQANAQIAERLELIITIKKGAKLGCRDLRIVTQNGYSNRINFIVGDLPECREKEPNNYQDKATLLPKTPCLVNGQIMPGDFDCFRFQAKKGDMLVCQVQARLLVPYLADAVPGWFQATLTLYNQQGKEVAYNDDFYFNLDTFMDIYLI